MTENVEKNSKRFQISEGVLLASGPALAYFFAFYYEKGFASHFDIPIGFITVDLKTVLVFTGIILSLFLLFFPILNYVISLLNPSVNSSTLRSPLYRKLYFYTIAALIVGTQIYLLGFANWKTWIWYFIILSFFAVLDFIFPLLTQWRAKSYSEKLLLQDKHDQKSVTLLDLAFRRFGPIPIIIGLIVVSGMAIAENAGRGEALNQKEFLVTNTTPEMVVLRIYGDTLVCTTFDSSKREITGVFKFIKWADNPGLALEYREIGPLTNAPKQPVQNTVPTSNPLATVTPVIPINSTLVSLTPVITNTTSP